MSICYRQAAQTDCMEMARLSAQLGYPSDSEAVANRLAAIRSLTGHEVLVAAAGDLLLGWVHVHGRHLVETDAFAEIGGLVVDLEARKQGIGKRLIALAEEWAASSGYTEVRVRSNGIREAAHAFYEQIGYENTKWQKVFSKKLTPMQE